MTNGPVFATVADGVTLYLGGDFTYIGPHTGPGALISSATTADVVSAFPAVSGAAGASATAALPDGQGGWYVGGTFNNVGGVSRSNIVRIRSDNTVDALFLPTLNGPVLAMGLSSDGNVLYVGGTFNTVNGVTRNNLAAINTVDGTLDSGWNPDVNATVRSIVVSSDDSEIYVGGDFTSVGGVVRNHIANILSVDGTTVAAWDPNANGIVRTLELSGSNLYAGGDFTLMGGQVRNRLAAINTADGTVTSWNPDVNGIVRDIDINGGIVYVGGDFTTVGGQARNHLGSIDITDGTPTSWNPNADNVVRAVAILNNTVVAGGDFLSAGGAQRRYIVRFPLRNATNDAGSWYPSVENSVEILVPALDGSAIFVGGSFLSAGGAVVNDLAAIDTSNGHATAWRPNVNGPVRALTLTPGGTKIYAGGDFTVVGGQARNRLAAINIGDGTTTAWDPNVNAPVRALAVSVGGSTIYAGGDFTAINGLTAVRNHLAAINISDGTATAWDPNGDNVVRALALSPDGNSIYAGGDFTLVGGQARNRLAAINASDGTATAWDPNVNAPVRALAVSADGSMIYAGGDFTAVNGLTVVRNHLAAISASDGTATAWDPNTDNVVRALASSADGSTVYAGGDFTLVGGQVRNRLAAVDTASGTVDPVWNPSVNLSVETLTLFSGSQLLVSGGQFTTLDGIPRIGLAGFDFSGPVTVAAPPAGIYNSGKNVTLNCTDEPGSGCARTFFTLDGTDPVTSDGQTPGSPSTILYTKRLRIGGDTLLKYFSVDNAGNVENTVHSDQYFIDEAPPVTVVNPPGDRVFMSQKLVISLSCTDGQGTGCVDTFFTLDDSTPTTSSTRYSGPILLKDSAVLKVFSTDRAGNKETVQRLSYVKTYGGIGTVNWVLLSILLAGIVFKRDTANRML